MMEEQLIAPCGMNCCLCISYQAMKLDLKNQGFNRKYCPGCIPRGKNCTFMADQCELVGKGKVRFCTECLEFPCKRLKSLDKRYRGKYHMSMIENLNYMKENGMEKFLENQDATWKCPECGGVICCHNGLCLSCDLEVLREKRSSEKERKDSNKKTDEVS